MSTHESKFVCTETFRFLLFLRLKIMTIVKHVKGMWGSLSAEILSKFTNAIHISFHLKKIMAKIERFKYVRHEIAKFVSWSDRKFLESLNY